MTLLAFQPHKAVSSNPPSVTPTITDYDMVETTSASSDDMVFTYPATINNGDLLLAVILDDDSTPSSDNYTAAAGYTQRLYNNGNDAVYTVFSAVADGTETGTVTFALASGDNRNKVGYLLVIENANTTDNPIKVTGGNSTGTGTTGSVSGITTLEDNALVLAIVAFDGSDGGPISVTAGDFILLEAGEAGAGSVGVSAAIATQLVATAGDSGGCTFAFSVSDGHVGVQLAFNPA